MIGLGSNRLTVCRRGGMAITQAGSGGMEWLAGGRVPLWAQWWLPYSRQAGEALKDAYPQYWNEIKQYGFDHPECVERVNTYIPLYGNEDPAIIFSLVDISYKRYLIGDGTAYISLPTTLNFNKKIELIIDAKDYLQSGIRYNSASGDDRFYAKVANSSFFSVGANNVGLTVEDTSRMHYEAVVENGRTAWSVNGVAGTPQTFGTQTVRLSSYIFFGSYQNAYRPEAGQCARYYMLNDDVERDLVPFVLGTARTAAQCIPNKACAVGTNGMLDLVSGKFHPNANSSGTFTMTPAS